MNVNKLSCSKYNYFYKIKIQSFFCIMSFKLLQINTTSNYGSTGRIVEGIGELAKKAGWDSYLIHGPRYVNPSQLDTICSENRLDEIFHGINSLFFDAHGLGSKKATKRVVRCIELINPDIIHLHNIHGYYINYPILFQFLKSFGKPLVWTFHDCWNFTGHCAYFDLVKCNKWQNECTDCPNSKGYPKSFIDNSRRNYQLKKESFQGIENLIVVPVSQWLSNLLDNSFFLQYEKKVIYNGIDINAFTPVSNSNLIRNLYNLQDKFVIICVASPWTERKGFKDILKLSSIIPDDSVIVMIGVSAKQKKILPQNIIGIERTDNINQLAHFYSESDLFFNPTWEDNFPTTNLEALACGIPVVTYNTGGSPEAITKDTGFVVKQGDYYAVLNIIDLVRSKGKQYFISKCRNRAVNFYNRDSRFKEYINLYYSIL